MAVGAQEPGDAGDEVVGVTMRKTRAKDGIVPGGERGVADARLAKCVTACNGRDGAQLRICGS